jgi:hypothetical protein
MTDTRTAFKSHCSPIVSKKEGWQRERHKSSAFGILVAWRPVPSVGVIGAIYPRHPVLGLTRISHRVSTADGESRRPAVLVANRAPRRSATTTSSLDSRQTQRILALRRPREETRCDMRAKRPPKALLAENLMLRHQLIVLQRSVGRPQLRPMDRLLWAVGLRRLSNWKKCLVIVQPATVRDSHLLFPGLRVLRPEHAVRGSRGARRV